MPSNLKRLKANGLLAGILFAIALCSTAFAQSTLYVGAYNTEQIFRYSQSGAIIQPEPWIGPTLATSNPTYNYTGTNPVNTTPIQGEGIAVGVGFPTSGVGNTFGNIADPVYIANAATGSIEVADANAAATANPIVNASFITGLDVPANIALSKNGDYLYVAQEGSNSVSEYNALTGTLIATATGIPEAHDVEVSANGTVYVTGYDAGTGSSVGVITFDDNLRPLHTAASPLIAPGSSVAIGGVGAGVILNHPTGMTFDASGNLWVANVYAPGGSVIGSGPSNENFVSEYSISGTGASETATLLRTIESSGNHLYTVFGLSLGPDGNIYAASFNGQEITEINTSTYALSTFNSASPLPPGDEPKYAIWGSDAVTYSPVPEPKAYGAITLLGVIFLLAFRRLKRAYGTTAPA